jgi:hypothetical protein
MLDNQVNQEFMMIFANQRAFDLLLKEAWNPEQAAMGNSTLPTVSDKLNIMASIHNRNLIAALSITMLENKLNELSIQQ